MRQQRHYALHRPWAECLRRFGEHRRARFACASEPESGDPLVCEFIGPANVCGGTVEIPVDRLPGTECESCGQYLCLGGTTACIGGADTGTDRNNCGGCGIRCNSDEFCSFGGCVRDPVVQVALNQNGTAGEHTCVLVESGKVRCFGRNASGELGDGTTASSAEPVDVSGLENVVEVRVGERFSCAWLADGRVACWGVNDRGQLGYGYPVVGGLNAPNLSVGTVVGVEHAIDLDSHADLSCVIEGANAAATSGEVVCWGRSQLSGDYVFGVDSATATVNAPTAIPGLSNARTVAAGNTQACALDTLGDAYCWGQDAPTGIGSSNGLEDTAVPTLVPSTGTLVAIDVSSQYACGVDDEGHVWCWGWNRSRRLGRAESSSSPQQVPGIDNALEVATADRGACARLSTGQVVCWGAFEGLGRSLTTGNNIGEPTPALVAGLDRLGVAPASYSPMEGALTLTAGGAVRFCALREEGEVRCWGDNQRNRLGLGFSRSSDFQGALVGRPTPTPFFGPQLSEFTRCADGIDNDGDGSIDCADTDCAVDLGSAEGINVLLETWVDWGAYERVSSPFPATSGHKTIRFTWTAPRTGEYRFTINNSGAALGYSQGLVDLRRISCGGAVETGGASPTLVVAAGETVYGIIEVTPSNTLPLVQMGISQE